VFVLGGCIVRGVHDRCRRYSCLGAVWAVICAFMFVLLFEMCDAGAEGIYDGLDEVEHFLLLHANIYSRDYISDNMERRCRIWRGRVWCGGSIAFVVGLGMINI
jgi:hypothetical protein